MFGESSFYFKLMLCIWADFKELIPFTRSLWVAHWHCSTLDGELPFHNYTVLCVFSYLTSLNSLSVRKQLEQSAFAYWDLLGPSGSFWVLPDSPGLFLWVPLGPSGSIWVLLGPFGSFRSFWVSLMGPSGSI